MARSLPFRIKVCGLTTSDDIDAAAEAGVEAVGLNFVASSPRCIDLATAQVLAARAQQHGLQVVGVFVNAAPDTLRHSFVQAPLDFLQLHGDETPEFLLPLADLPLIKALRLGDRGLSPVLKFLERTHHLGCVPQAVLVDALTPGAYGGTGQTVDWSVVARYAQQPDVPPLILAGGLKPSNVAAAIAAVHPAAIDTASGVESSPGRKDPQQMRAFVQAALGAWSVADESAQRPAP